jgi:retron-type reverse transcriptase
LQSALHAKAKEEPGYRFYLLYDKVYRADVLEVAYRCCKANKGAAGVDGQTFEGIEAYGEGRWLGELADRLRTKTYEPEAVKRVWIPKPNSSKLRPLGVPTITDRVVETATLLVLEPIFEADLAPEQYAYRHERGAHDAIRAVHRLLNTGHTQVIDADLSGYFDSIPHAELLQSVARRIVDRHILRLIKAWLVAPVEEDDGKGRTTRSRANRDGKRGTPQGAPITPQTQKVTSSLNGALRCAARSRSLIYDAKSNMFVSNVAILRRREGPTLERCIRSAQPRPRRRVGGGDADRAVRLVATSSLSLSAGSPIDQASGAGIGTLRGDHRQGARGHSHEVARSRPRHRFDDRRRGLACRLGLVGAGASAWLSATGVAKFVSSIAMTVCSAPSSNRPMTSWFPIAPVAPTGLAE